MSNRENAARDEILASLRRGLSQPRDLFRGDRPARHQPPFPVTNAAGDHTMLARLFAENLQAVAGSHERVQADEVIERVIDLARRWSTDAEPGDVLAPAAPLEVLSWAPHELVIPDIERRLGESNISLVAPDNLHDPEQRSRAGDPAVGVTGVEAAFASTGSVLLTTTPARNRSASLLPLYHIMIVPMSRIYPTLEDWLEQQRRIGRLSGLLREASQVVFVTGPSKSADIELKLTLGVHGPRVVHAILFDDVG